MSVGWRGRVIVRDSSIQGRGIFAARWFSAGETVLVREERPVTVKRPLDPDRGEYEHHCDWLEGGRQVYLGYPERYLNHCCTHNAYVRTDEGAGRIIALRAIEPGEEITNHYAIAEAGGNGFECACGSDGCLGYVPGNFVDLPPAVREKLQPLLPEWFRREHPEVMPDGNRAP